MKNSIKIGNLYVRKIVGKEWKEGGPSILLCHGFGAQGDDLVGLHQIVKEPSKFQWFFPEGIVEIDFGFGMKGRAWWPINFAEWNQFLEDGKPEMLQERLPEGMLEASKELSKCIDVMIKEDHVDPTHLFLGGFSQGAMLATDVILHSSLPLTRLIILSGTLLCKKRWEICLEQKGNHLKILMSHGQNDPVLSFSNSVSLKDLLRQHGATINWIEHDGQHEIPQIVLKKLAEFLNSM